MITKNRFSIEETTLAAEGKLPERKCYTILDNDIPDYYVNTFFVAQSNSLDHENKSGRDHVNAHNYWVKFANYMWNKFHRHYSEATVYDILAFLDWIKKEGIKNSSVKQYIIALHKMFSHLMIYYNLDESLFELTPQMIAKGVAVKSDHLIIDSLKKLYPTEKRTCLMPQYEKWLTVEQASKISKLLRLDYRCVFLITYFTGFRIDSALSIKLQNFNLKQCSVRASRSKNGLVHTAPIPKALAKEIQNYVDFIRIDREDFTNPCDALFLGKDGQEMEYGSFYQALNRVGELLGEELHSHAGRSSFLAMMRTKQLTDRRAGKETFTDEHLMALMDWKTMSSLHNYDKMNRVEEVLPFVNDYFGDIYKEILTKEISFSEANQGDNNNG